MEIKKGQKRIDVSLNVKDKAHVQSLMIIKSKVCASALVFTVVTTI